MVLFLLLFILTDFVTYSKAGEVVVTFNFFYRNYIDSKLNYKKGQSLTEFALVLPIIIMIFIGAVEFGLILNDYVSINRAVTDACKYGSTLSGYSSAEVVIVGRLLDGLTENIKKSNLRIVNTKTQIKYGPFTKSAGTVYNNGSAVSAPNYFGTNLFFRYNAKSVTDSSYTASSSQYFTDAVAIPPEDLRATHVELRVEYDHDVVIPYADLINASTFKISSYGTWPITAIYPNQMNGFKGTGALPIAVLEDPAWVRGQNTILKGEQTGPGGFGWIDLTNDPNLQGGNDIVKLVTWIGGGGNTPPIIPPQMILSFTGQKNASSIRDALNQLAGKKIIVPMYDTTTGTGNNLQYHLIGFTEFIMNSAQNYPLVEATFSRILYKKTN